MHQGNYVHVPCHVCCYTWDLFYGRDIVVLAKCVVLGYGANSIPVRIGKHRHY